MTISLRDYQERFVSDVFNAWSAGNRNVLGVMPTGAGKSVALAEIVRRNAEPTCVMVHRGELVAQLSETLALVGITHRVIASKSTVAMCVSRHVKRFGRSYIHEQSPVGVASVQTIVRRGDKLKQWLPSVKLVVADEGHHYLAENQFGTAVAMFPNAKVLGVTATPDRCDRKSLARVQKTGLFDTMVEGPSPRWLIDQGFLSPYKLIAPPPSIHMEDADISPGTGEFKADAVRKKSHESRIVGDVVETWKRFGEDRQTIVFTVDVETSTEVAKAFNDAGIAAASVSGKTPDSMRNALVDKFSSGQLKILSNCDLFSEGFDVPAATCAILARPTMSLGMYRQQVGRVLRNVYCEGFDLSSKEGRLSAIANGEKPYAIIIDHVENFKRHGLLDVDRTWSLIRPDVASRSKNRDDEIPLKSCVNDGCWKVYPATLSACPHCGHKPEPLSRGSIEHVEGNLIEYSPELLAKLRGEVARVDGEPVIPYGASPIVEASVRKRWRERSEAQKRLRDTIALWAGVWRDKGATDSESYRRFYFTFGTDVLSAQALGATEAEALRQRVDESLGIRYEAVMHLPGVKQYEHA